MLHLLFGTSGRLLLKPVTYCDFTLDPDPGKQKPLVSHHFGKVSYSRLTVSPAGLINREGWHFDRLLTPIICQTGINKAAFYAYKDPPEGAS
ncbi:hypothetical protein C5612_08420 [Pseudomonas frederiksbergensis]|uniref:Uncharacterized protein n=1 Tax=Pseudomonas frederiksbergensis TaxID=104087 RepID=A0A2S8HQM9_9PSED|nr:hypothetical protein C5612_08420 [Pseudomonas frederiksbergensis]